MIRNYCIGDNVNRRRREVGAQHCILTSRGAEKDRASEQNLGELGSYPIYETHIAASTFRSIPSKSLFVRMLAASAKPNKLWSVKTVRTPSRCACKTPSCPREDKLACEWISVIRSRRMMVRK